MDKSAALFRASNIEIMDYPFAAALQSSLMVCDTAVVVVGQSEDNTVEAVRREASKYPGRVRVALTIFQYDLMWQEKWWTLAQSLTDAEWLMYYDADEVIHEDAIPSIKDAMADPDTWLISFPFIHFYMTASWERDYPPRATRLGRRSRGYRMRNWRSDRMPEAPACQMVYTDHEINAHNPAHTHTAVLKTPIYHYSWCRDARAAHISHLKHNDWYADGSKFGLVDGELPDIEPFDYIDTIRPLIEQGKVWPSDVYNHPAAIKPWMENHVERWQGLERDLLHFST